MYHDEQGRLLPPPVHPRHPSAAPSPRGSTTNLRIPSPAPPSPTSSTLGFPSPALVSPARSAADLAPPLPPRPSSSSVTVEVDEGSGAESDSDGESFAHVPSPGIDAGASTESLVRTATKDEEELSEIQLRELYDDEEIERFLHLFSTYVREVRAADLASPSPAKASLSAPSLVQPLSPGPTDNGRTPWISATGNPRTVSEIIAQDLLVPLLPAPRQPPPDFALNRLKQTAQRLYVAVEPLYCTTALPLLRLATWQNSRRSFGYCALYWVLWYHGLLLSALAVRLLYELVSRKLHPYPTLAELREHRKRIGRAQTFGRILSTRLATSRALGLRDMWDLVGDYRHIQRLNKARKESEGKNEVVPEVRTSLDDDAAGAHNVSFSTSDLPNEKTVHEKEEADLKRLGLFFLNEAADLLERIKNIFLWRQPSASTYYTLLVLGWFILGMLPAHYLVRSVGLLIGGFFWHVVPVIAAIPAAERSRIPPPLSIVPTDTEYAMDLISQRVARGLPVRPKRRRHGVRSDDEVSAREGGGQESSSSSVDWNKWGGRLASTKERAGEVKQMLQDGQWKQAENWKALNPLSPKVVALQSGAELRIEAQTFPAQLRKSPGLITLTQTTLFFTPLLSARPTLTVPLADITAVRKTTLTKGIDVHYTETETDGTRLHKEANFFLVGSRSDLFARLVSWGGSGRWANV
ncbi:hypothetical protein C8Q80DRAFT_68381 [Daedaleopsis nitida]|nr:hypothetical protein C8Q80DRAFT_68381 [Daedaleopsis nitida]